MFRINIEVVEISVIPTTNDSGKEKRDKERPEKPAFEFGPVLIFTYTNVGQIAKMSSSHFGVR